MSRKSLYFDQPYGGSHGDYGFLFGLFGGKKKKKAVASAVINTATTGHIGGYKGKKSSTKASPALTSALLKPTLVSKSLVASSLITVGNPEVTFAFSNPSIEKINQRYGSKTSFELKGIEKGLREAKKKISDGLAEFKDSLSASAKLNREEEIADLGNLIGILGEMISLKSFEEEQKRADDKAVAKGLKSAEDAIAIREVELEWYFQLYGERDPIKVLAYQKIEKDKYGITSYQAKLQGKQLIEPASPELEANRRAGDAEASDIASDIGAAEKEAEQMALAEAKQKQMMVYGIGGLAVIGAAAFFLMRDK